MNEGMFDEGLEESETPSEIFQFSNHSITDISNYFWQVKILLPQGREILPNMIIYIRFV